MCIVHGFQKLFLFFGLQKGQLHRRIEGNLFLIHHIQQFRDQFGQTDEAPNRIFAYPCLVTNLLYR